MLRQSTVGHEFVDEDLVTGFHGAAEETDEVRMADGGNEADFVEDLMDSVGVSIFETFDGDPFSVA